MQPSSWGNIEGNYELQSHGIHDYDQNTTEILIGERTVLVKKTF